MKFRGDIDTAKWRTPVDRMFDARARLVLLLEEPMNRTFHLGDILSITHDRLVSPRLMDGIYDICNFLTQDNLFTHQLPRVHAECKAHLLTLYPALNEIPMVTDEDILAMKLVDGKPAKWWESWLAVQVAKYGEFLEVTPIAAGIHEYKNPITEAVEMVGPDKVIVIKEF